MFFVVEQGQSSHVPDASPAAERESAPPQCPEGKRLDQATEEPSADLAPLVHSPDRPLTQTVHPLASWALLLGILSLVCFGAGPVLGLAALVVGGLARRKIQLIGRAGGQIRGGATALAGMMAGALSVLCFAVVLFVYARMIPSRSNAHSKLGSQSSPHAATATQEDPTSSGSPAAGEPPHLPTASTLTQVGDVTVVDVAAGVPSLAKELDAQRTAAASHGERMLVETITGSCSPCQGLSKALGDAAMQRALRSVRLVRIDRDQFEEDLDELEIPSRPWPSFFLLDSDLRVRDAIDGDEWDDDIAANMAPVLGSFLRGTYTKRRNPWHHAPRPSGTVL